MTQGSERLGDSEHQEMLEALRQILRKENGVKNWLVIVSATVAAAAIIGAAAVWRTQGQIVVRLDHVETDVAEIRSDVRDIRDKVVGAR